MFEMSGVYRITPDLRRCTLSELCPREYFLVMFYLIPHPPTSSFQGKELKKFLESR